MRARSFCGSHHSPRRDTGTDRKESFRRTLPNDTKRGERNIWLPWIFKTGGIQIGGEVSLLSRLHCVLSQKRTIGSLHDGRQNERGIII